MALLLAACGSEASEQAQVVAATATPIATTAPIAVPTATPDPTPTAVPQATPTPLPTPVPPPTLVPTALPTLAPPPSTAVAEPAPATADVLETPTAAPTPLPTAAPEPTVAVEDASGSDSVPTPSVTVTAVAAVSGEPPLECYDAEVQVYRAFVDGVDVLSFEGGRVYCSGAGTDEVSAAGSYRHSSGLVVSRNADYIFDDAGTAYIPYSGSVHFCMSGQAASAPVRADTVPALLIVIDNEAQRQIAQGASRPLAFSGGGSQC